MNGIHVRMGIIGVHRRQKRNRTISLLLISSWHWSVRQAQWHRNGPTFICIANCDVKCEWRYLSCLSVCIDFIWMIKTSNRIMDHAVSMNILISASIWSNRRCRKTRKMLITSSQIFEFTLNFNLHTKNDLAWQRRHIGKWFQDVLSTHTTIIFSA